MKSTTEQWKRPAHTHWHTKKTNECSNMIIIRAIYLPYLIWITCLNRDCGTIQIPMRSLWSNILSIQQQRVCVWMKLFSSKAFECEYHKLNRHLSWVCVCSVYVWVFDNISNYFLFGDSTVAWSCYKRFSFAIYTVR